MAASSSTPAPPPPPSSSHLSVVDLRSAELATPSMVEAAAAAQRAGLQPQLPTGRRSSSGAEGSGIGSGSISSAGVWVGLQRYALHVPTLHGEGGGRQRTAHCTALHCTPMLACAL